jgi:transcription-repair coupling factor (superfamily II helicase)
VRLVSEAVNAFKKQAGAPVDSDPSADDDSLEVRVELPVDANLPHEYIPSDVLRLDAYRKIADAASAADLAGVRAELEDRFGPIPPAVEALLAVAELRQAARNAGVGEVIMGPQGVRVGPLDLAESSLMRLNRLYPGSRYSKNQRTLTVRAPAESDRIGAAPLRDAAIVRWAHSLLANLSPTPATRG